MIGLLLLVFHIQPKIVADIQQLFIVEVEPTNLSLRHTLKESLGFNTWVRLVPSN